MLCRWLRGLAARPVLWILGCWLGLVAGPLHAQPAADAPAPAQARDARPAFALEIEAPANVRPLLERHLDLQRYRTLTDLDAVELDRLLASAERNARDLVATLGYFSPTVVLEQRAAPPGAPAPRIVRLQLQPGEPTRIASVEIAFSGPVETDPAAGGQRATIQADWPLRPGRVFTQAAWEEAKGQALRQLTSTRFPTGEIASSRAEIDADRQQARLFVTLASGPVYRFGALQVQGAERYDAELARRLARLPSGDSYDQARLLEAQQRLAASGFFDSVYLTLDTTGDPGAATVVAQVREASLQKVVLGVGASTDGGPRVSIEHTHRRLPGIGWQAVSRLSLDRATQSLGSELTAPPDERNWRWIASALVQRQDSGTFTTYSQRLRAGRTQTGERVDRSYYLQYDRARSADADSSDTAEALSANYAWTERNFDSLPFPTAGYGLGVEVGGGLTLRGDRQPYGRVLARWLGLRPLGVVTAPQGGTRAARLALRAEGGAVVARESAQIPDTQLFLTGGDTTVRGYGYRDIGTQLPGEKVTAGRYLVVGSVEWQRPLVLDGRISDWESAVFLDAGAVADRPGQFDAKVGIGAGVRWRSPVGPLQIDLAYGLDARRLRLHLNVGFTF